MKNFFRELKKLYPERSRKAKNKIIIFLGIILAFLLLPKISWAATINAAFCSQTDVQAAIASATTGDTVQIPAGECFWIQPNNWLAAIVIPDNKKLIIRGVGIDAATPTIIHEATPNYPASWPHLALGLGLSGSTVTGIIFSDAAITTAGNNFRVHHCKFVGIHTVGGGTSILLQSAKDDLSITSAGLVDNNIFINKKGAASTPGPFRMWTLPLDLGTGNNALYVEDNIFTCTEDIYCQAVDADYGGAYVFRYNTLNGYYIEAHSIRVVQRATRRWEVYGNVINAPVYKYLRPFFLRAGTGVIFYNSIGNWSLKTINLDNIRGTEHNLILDPPGFCDGTSGWDGNEAIDNLAIYGDTGTGTHTGADNASILTDDTKHWTASSMVYLLTTRPGATVYNVTDGSRCVITANTANTVTCTLTGGTDNDWDTGDTYKITDGYPCRDQIGRGPDAVYWNGSGVFTQPLIPAYAWRNLLSTSVEAPFTPVNGNAAHIKSGRDFYNYTASFNGTSGVGCGTLAARPATCTTGVAYWATNQSCSDLTGMIGANPNTPLSGTLYKCTVPNAWTAYFTPYQYPHPLQLGTGIIPPPDTTPPAPPSGVTVS